MNFELITLLADGEFHSGKELGEQLGMTRAGVWKLVSQLQQFGLNPHSVRGVGYRLPEPLKLLSHTALPAMLSAQSLALLEQVQIVPSLTSTNDHIRAGLPPGHGYTLCIAEHQLQGRGRRGRSWSSPYGTNLYLSLGLQFDAGFEALNGLSLMVGIAVAETFASMQISSTLKWPNDVLINHKKIAGILVEIDGEQGGPLMLVIGIGVNVNMQDDRGSVDQPWTSLALERSSLMDRNTVAASLVNNLLRRIEEFKLAGFSVFRELWNGYDAFAGKTVQLASHDSVNHGICRGVDERGYLVLDCGGEKRFFGGGELSLKLAEERG